MFDDVTVIGAGRAGTVIAARLRERRLAVHEEAELRLLCVPDRAIAEVARSIQPGPWVAHVSGGTPLAALSAVTPANAPSSCSGPRRLVSVWRGCTEKRRVCGSSAASGVPPET